jgi:hypothetical protein
MEIKDGRSIAKNINLSTSQLLQSCTAKYLVVVVSRGMTSEVNHVNSLKEAKRFFGKIARDHRYKPAEINASDKYDVSIWKWIGDRYEDINYYP